MCKKNVYRLCNIRRLEQNIKSRCNPHFFQNAWRLKCSTVRMICMCEQCDSAFCALQLTALIKPNCCVLQYCCACLYHSLIVVQPSWTTVRCPKTFAGMKHSVISVALRTPLKTRLLQTSLRHRPTTILVLHQAFPPHFTTKLPPCVQVIWSSQMRQT